MSVSTPIQTGGAAVIGLTLVKGGVNAVRGFPETGARVVSEVAHQMHVIALSIAGIAVAVGALVHGGKGRELSAGGDLDDGSSI